MSDGHATFLALWPKTLGKCMEEKKGKFPTSPKEDSWSHFGPPLPCFCKTPVDFQPRWTFLRAKVSQDWLWDLHSKLENLPFLLFFKNPSKDDPGLSIIVSNLLPQPAILPQSSPSSTNERYMVTDL